jgi:hypothetical protein
VPICSRQDSTFPQGCWAVVNGLSSRTSSTISVRPSDIPVTLLQMSRLAQLCTNQVVQNSWTLYSAISVTVLLPACTSTSTMLGMAMAVKGTS